MPEQPDYKGLLHPKCKVCRSPLGNQIDEMLMGKLTHPDTDEPFKGAEIIDWAGARGLTLSAASLSRHRNNHLMAEVLMSIETQRTVEAIAQATGKSLGLEEAYLQMFLHKAMIAMSNVENLDLSAKGVLGATIRSVEALLKVKKAELVFSKEKVEEAKSKMRSNGVSEDVLRMVDEYLGAA